MSLSQLFTHQHLWLVLQKRKCGRKARFSLLPFLCRFFSLSLFSEVITASKTNGGEHAICSPTNLPLHPGGLGRVLSWKFMRCSRGWKQRFYINTETKQGNGTCFALIMSGSPLKDSTLNLSVMWPLVSFFKNDIHWVRPLHWTSGKVRKMLT